MHLTHNTIAILRSFAKINTGIRFEHGHTLRTISPGRKMYGETVLEAECSTDAHMFSMKDFLHLIARSDHQLELSFDTTASADFPHGCVTVREVTSKKRLGCVGLCDPEMVKVPSHRRLPDTAEADCEFDLTAADLAYLTKYPDNGKGQIVVRSSGPTVRLDKMINDSLFSFIEVPNTVPDAPPFQGAIKIQHLKCLMPGPYTVRVCQKGIAYFQYRGFPLKYWIDFVRATPIAPLVPNAT